MNDLLGPSASFGALYLIHSGSSFRSCLQRLPFISCFLLLLHDFRVSVKTKAGYQILSHNFSKKSSLSLITPTWRRKKDQYKFHPLEINTVFLLPCFSQGMHYSMWQTIYLISRPHIIPSILEVKDIMDQASSRKHYIILPCFCSRQKAAQKNLKALQDLIKINLFNSR